MMNIEKPQKVWQELNVSMAEASSSEVWGLRGGGVSVHESSHYSDNISRTVRKLINKDTLQTDTDAKFDWIKAAM